MAGAGYVEQFDTLLPELTVREMLLYTAELKCPRTEPLSDKRARVEQLLDTLALGRCAGTLIGDALARGISGGQVSAPPPLPWHARVGYLNSWLLLRSVPSNSHKNALSSGR